MKLFSINLKVTLTPRGVFGIGCGVLAVAVVGCAGLAAMGTAVAVPAAVLGYIANAVAVKVYDDLEYLAKSIRVSKDVKNLFNKYF